MGWTKVLACHLFRNPGTRGDEEVEVFDDQGHHYDPPGTYWKWFSMERSWHYLCKDPLLRVHA